MPTIPLSRQSTPGAVDIPAAYQRLRWALSLLLRVFFRRVEVVGLENLPADRGGILVAAHPNGLVDPTLILAAFTHHVVFGARSGLFRIPVLGAIIRGLGTVPICRRGGSGSPGEMGEAPQLLRRSAGDRTSRASTRSPAASPRARSPRFSPRGSRTTRRPSWNSRPGLLDSTTGLGRWCGGDGRLRWSSPSASTTTTSASSARRRSSSSIRRSAFLRS